jgi:hypothetical protein
MAYFYLLLLSFICLRIISSQSTILTFTFQEIQIDPFYLKYIKFDLGNLIDPMKFKVDFDLKVYKSISTPISYNFPFEKLASKLDGFTLQLRLFNLDKNSVSITLVAECLRKTQDCDLEALSRIMTIKDSEPKYAEVETDKLFAIVLNKDFLSGVQLPTNLYNPKDTIAIDFPIENFVNGLSYDQVTDTETVYDSSFWNGFSTILTPWIPFFTYCGGEDKRLYLYDILENNSKDCKYINPDDTKVIGTIPTNGLEPKSDSCNLNYKCYYRDNGVGKSYGTPWYSIKEDKVLYHFYRKPITSQEAYLGAGGKLSYFNLVYQSRN